MTAPQDKAKSIFLHAVEMASAAERQAYVVRECGGDEALRREVEEFLRFQGGLGSFLESPGRRLAATLELRPPAERAGTVIGPYKVLQQIGEGGMGTVFMAEQTHPVQRKVALKVIRPGNPSSPARPVPQSGRRQHPAW